MPPKITRVKWSAQDIPWGLSFDETNGTFTGTPEDEGKYTVPVTVQTDYGKDTKDVGVLIEPPYNGVVYAMGRNASSWSDNSEADKYGFIKLNMPKVNRLISLNYGFFGKVSYGKWYGCATEARYLGLNNADIDATKPFEYPISGILEVASTDNITNTSGNHLTCFLYRKENNECHILLSNSNDTYPINEIVVEDTIKLIDYVGYSYLFAFFSKKANFGSIEYNYLDIKKLLNLYNNGIFCCLTTEGDIFVKYTKIEHELGKIVDIWKAHSGGNIYALTEKNELYCLVINFSEYVCISITKDFTGKVKKIVGDAPFDFLLLYDGTLHVKTSMANPNLSILGIENKVYNEFTTIFPDYRFLDIAYCGYASTIVVTMED